LFTGYVTREKSLESNIYEKASAKFLYILCIEQALVQKLSLFAIVGMVPMAIM
jgi:hypothetical protein